MKLIDKDKIVAEIESRKAKCDTFYNIVLSNNAELAKVAIDEQFRQYNSLLSFIDDLGVKEVDLDKEINKYISDNFYGSERVGFFATRTNGEPNEIDMELCAKHFFELGLKA